MTEDPKAGATAPPSTRSPRPKLSAPGIVDMKRRGELIAVLTAYDHPTARLADQAGVEILLVGDSVGTVLLGYESTLPVTMEDMLSRRKAGIPAGRLGTTSEFGAICAFLCSEKAGYINGQNILADGGAYPGTH